MCGIAATVDLRQQGRASSWALAHMRHRGPDGEGIFADATRNVVLEHTRLAIIDPENPDANQPLTDPTGRWAIAYNGEIFNFRALRADLEQRGVTFRTNSDTEVVLLGFAVDGPGLLNRLRGMFAFVVWDRETGNVFAARDQIGVKPLYWFARDGIFAAASEVRTLLAHPRLHAALDAAGVVEFLAFGGNLGERTVVEGISKVLPGHYLGIQNGDVTVHEYWDVLPTDGASPVPEVAAAELRHQLDAAVEAALVSDVPLGLMLSGGIDSSAVAALAVRHAPASEMTAYSVGFGRPDDESAAARTLARDLGLRHRIVHVNEAEVRAQFDLWLGGLDYPSGNPTWIATWFVARAAHADNIKVLLSGDGGDELFGGYQRWMKYLRFHDSLWVRTPAPLRRLGGRVVRRLASGLAGDIARRAASGGELFIPSRPFHDDLLAIVLGPAGHAAASAIPVETFVDHLRARYQEGSRDGDYLSWMSYVMLRTKLIEDFLQRLDKMGMQHSVEGRVPLLDPVLARWAFRTTQDVKVPALRQKALLREAVTPLLPHYVLERPKQGFCAPIADWTEELLLARALQPEGPLFDSGLLRRDALASAQAHRARAAFATWTLSMLVEWVNRNLATATMAEMEGFAA
jgi:asparagine synthase (glutamine-hydrolysing)